MLRAVIDTNVLVAALRSRRGSSFRLLELLGDPRWRPFVSVPLVLEYEDVLKRDFMHSTLGTEGVDDLLDYFLSVSELVEVRFRLRPVLRDPDDDRILEVAARAGAEIVTFNERDFTEAVRYGIEVRTPAQFLRQIGDIQ